MHSDGRTRYLRVASQIVLGLFLVSAGVSHLTVSRFEFQVERQPRGDLRLELEATHRQVAHAC